MSNKIDNLNKAKETRDDEFYTSEATIILTTLDIVVKDFYVEPLEVEIKGAAGDFKGFMGYYEDKHHIEYPCYYFNHSEDICLRESLRDKKQV